MAVRRRRSGQRGLPVGVLAILLAITACSETGGSEQTTTTSGLSATTTTQAAAQTTTTTTPTVGTVPDIPLVPRSELPDDFPQIPVPAGGEPGGPGFFDGETVGYEYPTGTLPTLVSFYEAWFATVGIDPGPTFGSSPSRYWDVTFEGMRVRFEIYETTNDSGDRLLINYFP